MACNDASGITEQTTEFMTESTQIDEMNSQQLPDQTENNEILSLATCTIKNYEYSEEYDKIIANVSYPSFSLQGEWQEKHLALNKILNTINAVKKTKQLEEYHSFLQQAKEDLSENPDSFYPYEFNESVLVRRADQNSLSLLFSGSSYAGGAHGDYYLWGENYEPSTGARIKLRSVVSDMEVLKKQVEEQLDHYWSDAGFYDDLDHLLADRFDSDNEDDLSWTIDYNGLTFYFNPYDIAPNASGIQIVTIPFTGNEDIFQEKYLNVPKEYGIQLTCVDPFFYDLDEDGEAEKISIYGEKNEYGYYVNHKICVNDEEYDFEMEGFSVEPTFIHKEDGGSYLYIQTLSDNDYRLLSIYRLGKGAKMAEKLETIGAGYESIIPEEEEGPYLQMALLDPKSFVLETPTDILSTRSGIKHYYMDENGLPLTDDPIYHMKEGITFTVKRDFDAELFDLESGSVGEQVKVGEGSKVVYYATDNVEYGFLLLEDDRIVRVKVNRSEWPITIKGVEIEDIFDGIVFAG
ncbi:MAG: DUF3298 domain-containing protein [Eubacteriales bacterium]|nr:DUF3298 domain-containing protein [Eubacteriales bacterium]